MGIRSIGLPGGHDGPAIPVLNLSGPADGLEAYRDLVESLEGAAGAGFCLARHGAADAGAVSLLERLAGLPVVSAVDGMAIACNRVYLQNPDRPLRIAGGCFRTAERIQTLPSEMNTLLQHTAELANRAPTLEDAVRHVMAGVAAGLGWLPADFRLFGNLIPPARQANPVRLAHGTDSSRYQHSVSSDQREIPVLIMPVLHGEHLLATMAFTLPHHGHIGGASLQLLERVAAQLAAVAARSWAQDDRLHHHVEAARQGRLTGMAELAHSLASELSQPLAAAMNYAGVLRRTVGRDDRSQAELQRLIERLVGQVQRAGEILHSVKDFAIRRGCPLEALDVAMPLRQALGLLEGELRNHGVVLSLELDPELPRVRGNSAYLEQILLSVIGHALEAITATDARRRMSLRAHTVGAEVRIVVTDGSGGIPLQWREELREGFGPPSVADSDPAALTTSRSLAEAQGGHLWIEEDPDGGVNFVLALPVTA